MEDATRPPDDAVDDKLQAQSGQALVEYSLIILLVIIASLTALYAFQDAVVNGLWGATQTLFAGMGG
jgi:hypothetical protein